MLAGIILLVALFVGFGFKIRSADDNGKTADRRAGGPAGSTAPVEASSSSAKPQPRNETAEKADDIDPAQAAKLLADFTAGNPNINAQGTFAADLVKRLCKAGHTDAAFALIGNDSGQVRNFMIAAFFEHAVASNNEILGRLVSMPKTDEGTALSGYMHRFAVGELAAVVEDPRMKQLIDEKTISKGSLSGAFTMRLMEAAFLAQHDKSGVDPVAVAAQMKKTALMSPENVLNLATNLPPMKSANDIASRWALVEDITPAAKLDKHSLEARSGLTSAMIRLNAPKTMELALEGPHQAYNIGEVVGQWAAIDTAGLGKWHQQNKQRMTAEQRTSFADGLISHSISHRDYESAKAWAAEIPDAAMAAEALERIAKAQEQG